ncbi:MAG TPA: LysE family transporter [Candidatus Nitrosotalea sp.]|nr:LysE family transporter [Candidatus Nitrosotalea sp.]
MPSITEFAATVIAISVSGVMSPGPLFASNVAYGIRGGWRSGIRMALGHTIVEGPLVLLIGIGALSLGALPQFRQYVSVLGAIALFVFAGLQVRSALQKTPTERQSKHGPFYAGIFLSALNPFFIVWWLTIGFKLISDAVALYSLVGIGLVFGFHIWMDYGWLGTVGFLSGRGRAILSGKNYRMLMVALAGVLVYFGTVFLAGSL